MSVFHLRTIQSMALLTGEIALCTPHQCALKNTSFSVHISSSVPQLHRFKPSRGDHTCLKCLQVFDSFYLIETWSAAMFWSLKRGSGQSKERDLDIWSTEDPLQLHATDSLNTVMKSKIGYFSSEHERTIPHPRDFVDILTRFKRKLK